MRRCVRVEPGVLAPWWHTALFAFAIVVYLLLIAVLWVGVARLGLALAGWVVAEGW